MRGRLKCWQQFSPLLDPLPTTTRQHSNCMNFPRYKVNYVSSCVEIQHPHVQTFRNSDSSPNHSDNSSTQGLPGHVLPKFWYCQKEGGLIVSELSVTNRSGPTTVALCGVKQTTPVACLRPVCAPDAKSDQAWSYRY